MSSQQVPPRGPTDYAKWDKFAAEHPSSSSSSSSSEDEATDAGNKPPQNERDFMRQQRKYKETLAEMTRTKARIAQLEAEEKLARRRLDDARGKERWWSTYGTVLFAVAAVVILALPQLFIHFGL